MWLIPSFKSNVFVISSQLKSFKVRSEILWRGGGVKNNEFHILYCFICKILNKLRYSESDMFYVDITIRNPLAIEIGLRFPFSWPKVCQNCSTWFVARYHGLCFLLSFTYLFLSFISVDQHTYISFFKPVLSILF